MQPLLPVAFLPVYQNPYQHLLAAALRAHGVEVESLEAFPSLQWLVRQRRRVRILHLHWLSGLYMQRWLTPFRVLAFLLKIGLAQKLGYKLVWTAHNVLPHKLPFPPLHRFIRRFVMRRADAVIAHCHYAREELLRKFPRAKPIFVIPHGNYDGVHPLTITRQQARHALGIAPGQFVYLLIGNISSYKGLDQFWQAFQQVGGPEDIALIAGRNRDPRRVAQLIQASRVDARLKVFPGFIAEQEMQHYLLAADVAVFAFEAILTSGTVILSLTHSLPVIAPALGCLPELITPEAGILYDPADPAGLPEALRQIKTRETIQMGRAARQIAAALAWDPIAAQTAAIYRTLLPS